MWRNDIKCKYMFMFSLKNLACKGLKQGARASTAKICWNIQVSAPEGSTLVRVMACCLTAPSHYLIQCSLITSKHTGDYFIRNINTHLKITHVELQPYLYRVNELTTSSPAVPFIFQIFHGMFGSDGHIIEEAIATGLVFHGVMARRAD